MNDIGHPASSSVIPPAAKKNPLLLLHGYSDSGDSYQSWKVALQPDFEVQDIHVCNYVTLNNEITIDDIAEGFDRALRDLNLVETEFDAIVHSTGMLVMRAWLTAPNASTRQQRLKRLIALAPATFGSPLAAKGRSLLGRIFKGNKNFGPDFLDSGNLVLFNLELGSTYTWNLAHKDLIGARPFYGADYSTPYVFVFDGTKDYGLLADIFDKEDQEGTDGTVRWAGCALNTRKITLDLTRLGQDRFKFSPWSNVDIPLIPIVGVNHGEILRTPPDELISLVKNALSVDSEADFEKFYNTVIPNAKVVRDGKAQIAEKKWQQFIVRACDERDNAVLDYSLSVVVRDAAGAERTIAGFEEDVHPYTADHSYRCFHVLLNDVQALLEGTVLVRFEASTGTPLVGFQGFGTEGATSLEPNVRSVDLDITGQVDKLFVPFTTTLIEIHINREPIRNKGGQFDIFGIDLGPSADIIEKIGERAKEVTEDIKGFVKKI